MTRYELPDDVYIMLITLEAVLLAERPERCGLVWSE